VTADVTADVTWASLTSRWPVAVLGSSKAIRRQTGPYFATVANVSVQRPASPTVSGRDVRGSARERLLSTARTLFFAEGIRATGIDRVIAESSIAKATLYNHFATKEDLVVAVLEAQLADWRSQAESADDPGAGPAQRVARLFDALAASVRQGEFRGCPFSNALTELPSSRSVRAVAERYRAEQLAHVAELLATEPTDATVRTVVLLLEGATNVTKTTGTPEEILLAREVAVALVAIRPGGSTRAGTH
jgi:AcrR family transcriptional regulator